MLPLMLRVMRHRSSTSRRVLGALVAFCLLTAPLVSTAVEMHELSHGAQHLQLGHEVTEPDHGDTPDGLHAILHGVHSCCHAVGVFPNPVALIVSTESVPSPAQLDACYGSAGPDLLFRPPRQN
jgi:hypothetical protein